MIKRFLKKTTKPRQPTIKDPIDILKSYNVWRKDEWQRYAMTVSCRDTDYIPKVKEAGKLNIVDGQEVQIMHNGVKVINGGYHGEWMSKIINDLKGHHEPQEEKLFYEITKRLDKSPIIIELGSFWSYYSIWIVTEFEQARAIACEPDPTNMKIGQNNAHINKVEDMISFIDAAAGSVNNKKIRFTLDSDQSQKITTKIRTVDSLTNQYGLNKVDILHMDVQGVELDALEGALNTIKAGKVRFVFVSTHHYFFSGDPMTHQKCKNFLIDNGATIIASHNVLESFSGDGLIVASFDERDRSLKIDVSLNHSDDSLFRAYEEDLSILIDEIRQKAKL